MVRNLTAYTPHQAARGLARVGAGLALVAAIAACGADDGSGTLARQAEIHRASKAAPTATPFGETPPAGVSPAPTDSAEDQVPDETESPPRDTIGGQWGLRIPAIGVETPVVSLTMTPERALVPPSDPSLVGWWSEGAGPGDGEGSVVIVGHSVSTGGGVFDDIDELKSGDRIQIEHLDYRVQSVEVMSKPDLARRAEEIFDQSVPERLVLVTCEGWDGETWQSNAVAIATPY